MRFLATTLFLLAAAGPASAQFAFSPMVGYDIDNGAATVGIAVELGTQLASLPLQPAIRPSVEYVFDSDYDSYVRLDGDLIGRFQASPGILPYAKAGVTVEFRSLDLDGRDDNSTTDVGLNLGGGAEFNRIFVEGALGIGDISDFRVRAGYRF